jgi:hypothetical protein
MSVTPNRPHVPIKRLTPAELQARREKGLCYNCEEKFVTGHRCKRLFHLLIVDPTSEDSSLQSLEHEDFLDPLTTETQDPVSDPAQISFHALMGHTIPQTLRVMGHIQQSPIAVLVDSGSTRNFLQDRIA